VKVLFAGTPRFALPSLLAVAASNRHSLVGVLTMPDRPRGRGRAVVPSPIKERADELGLPVLQPRKPSSSGSLEIIADLEPDVVAVVAYGRILKRAFIDLPRYGCVNVHGSLLPAFRGAAPIERAIQEGLAETGVTTMQIDEGLDTGDMLLREAVSIGQEETAGELSVRLAEVGARLLVETLDRIERGDCPRIPQDHAQATHAPPIEKKEACVDWSLPARRIVDLVRAMNPRPVAFTESTRGILRIYRAAVAEGAGGPGEVLAADAKKGLVVSAGEGAVRLRELQLPGRRRMNDSAMLAGTSFDVGVPLIGTS